MISWMQKHNKFLIWTIWIATIAFIASGPIFSGAGYGSSKAGNVAKVGDIEITQTKLNMVYSNIYNQYNERLQGRLDDKKAKEMGLIKQAFAQLQTQAMILNFAKELGIVVSDAEVLTRLEGLRGFQKNGTFNNKIYHTYLKSKRLKPNVFEHALREELIIQKTFSLLSVDALPFEKEAIAAGINVSDKLSYKVLTEDDLDFVLDEAKMKAFWQTQKENFLTDKRVTLSIVWTQSKDAVVTEDEIKTHYNTNSFNYTNETGKQLTFEEAKTLAEKDLKLKKIKKTAQKAYIAFKKGKLDSSEKITLPFGDKTLSNELWKKVQESAVGDILKPKVVKDKYATVKIEKIVLPKTKTYEEAKEEVSKVYISQAKKEALLTLAAKRLKNFDQTESIQSDFVQLEQGVNLKPLNNQESLQFLQKLFTSSKEKGIIALSNKVVAYNILEQKLQPMDENQTSFVNQTVNQLKERTFESNLIKMLHKKYPTEVYMGGLTN